MTQADNFFIEKSGELNIYSSANDNFHPRSYQVANPFLTLYSWFQAMS